MYAEFKESEYTQLRGSLIRRSAKGTDVQRQFLEAVRDTEKFLAYLGEQVRVEEGNDLQPLADRMSEAEFVNPPSDTERRLFDAWRALTPRIACRSEFWAQVTFRHIAEGRIESSFLAANGGRQISGAQRIDAALAAPDDEVPSLLDSCVRTVLRRLSGLPERGNRSVYVNCPLARAWWRERLVAEVATGESSGLEREIRAVVHSGNQEYWENLVIFVVSRNSVFGSAAVRNILIRTLAQRMAEESQSSLRRADKLKRICRTVSTIQASRELSVVPPEEVKGIMREVVDTVVAVQG